LPEPGPLDTPSWGVSLGDKGKGASGQVAPSCDVCGSTKDVVEFASYGVIRCLTHDPNYYGRVAS
jgi:hypothetical protein